MILLILIRNQFMTFNLFRKQSTDVQHGIRSTRVYVVLLAISMTIASIYSAVSLQTYTVTVSNPTVDQFERLHRQYSTELSCPCRRLSINYSSIMSIQPRFHQVCSSAFVQSEKWLSYWPVVFANRSRPTFNSFDFRQAGRPFFVLLKAFCELATKTIANALIVFYSNQLYSTQVLERDLFINRASYILTGFQLQVD
jgi:hypothetical protein